MHFTTTLPIDLLRTPPAFDGDERPHADATIFRITLTPQLAFQLLCDIGHIYASPAHRPRVGAVLENDGALTLYLWPRLFPNSALLLLLLDYGDPRFADLTQLHGQCWMTEPLLGRVLARLSANQYLMEAAA